MRKLLLPVGIAVALSGTASYAQMAGSAPSGPTPDIRNSDLGAHDSLSTPDIHDQIVRQRERELSDRIQAEQADKTGPSRPAKASEIVAGAQVNDKTGVAIAKIDEVDTDGVVVSDGTLKVKVPTKAFGHNKAGLLLDLTKAQFEQIVTKANAAS